MENEDNNQFKNNLSQIILELSQQPITRKKSLLGNIPELHQTYENLPPPSFEEITKNTALQTTSLTEKDVFETTAETTYGDPSRRPSLIGQRPLQTRDFLFMLTAYFCSFLSVGFLNSLGVLGVELMKDFPDSKTIIIVIPSVGIGLSSASGLLIGLLINKFGCPFLIIAGGFLQALALLISVFAKNPMLLLSSLGVLLGLGASCVFVTNSVFVGIYFGNRASIFLSILSTAGPIGSIIFPFLINLAIQQYSWHGCLLLFSGVYFHLIPSGIFLFFCQKKAQKNSKKNVIQLPQNTNKAKKLFDKSVFKNFLFTIFLFTMSTNLGLMNLILSNLPNFLVSHGFSLSMSAQAFSLMCITSIPPKLIMGIILRLTNWSFVYFYVVISICFAITVCITSMLSDFTSLFTCCIFLGLFIGSPIGLYSLIVLDLIGSQKYSSAMGISETINGIVIVCTGLVSGVLIKISASYSLPFYIFGAISIFSNLFLATILAKEYIKGIQLKLNFFSHKS